MTTAPFAFLTAEGGSLRYRLDDLLREVGRLGWLSSRAAPIAWGFGGFLIGAIFWYSIGFWSFLSGVVLKGPETSVSAVARPVVAPAVLENCTTLALNRATGRTYSAPCPDPVPVLDEASGPRQDFAEAEVR